MCDIRSRLYYAAILSLRTASEDPQDIGFVGVIRSTLTFGSEEERAYSKPNGFWGSAMNPPYQRPGAEGAHGRQPNLAAALLSPSLLEAIPDAIVAVNHQ